MSQEFQGYDLREPLCPRCQERPLKGKFDLCLKCAHAEDLQVAREIAYGHGYLNGYEKGAADAREMKACTNTSAPVESNPGASSTGRGSER